MDHAAKPSGKLAPEPAAVETIGRLRRSASVSQPISSGRGFDGWAFGWVGNKNQPRRPVFARFLAEREGFEPSVLENQYAGFRIRCIRPLCHLS